MQPLNWLSRVTAAAILTVSVTGLIATSASAQGTLTYERIQCLTDEQEAILSYMTLEMVDDGTGNLVPTIRIDGANLQVVNGLGSTQTSNSAGNLIVGYNEFGNPNGDDRTGSHNISFGEANSFSSFGGLVGAEGNTISGAFAVVSGGRNNIASALNSSVSGGRDNTASHWYASISGGWNNTASGRHSSVSGGASNMASGWYSSVSGGAYNTASAEGASVSGGKDNRASGDYASVSGGRSNTASNHYASVSGGPNNTAGAYYASVSGGRNNTAGTYYSHYGASVSGGSNRTASGADDWVAGSLFEDN